MPEWLALDKGLIRKTSEVEAMELIQQKFKADCAVASLAMFLGVDYEAVLRHCSGHELALNGLSNGREKFIAEAFEVPIKFLDRTKLERSKPADLTLPSLHSERGSTHPVFWDGKRVWDPNKGRPGKKSYANQMAWEVVIDGYQRA